MMTIRKCIQEMRNYHANKVILNNRTEINITEIWVPSKEDAYNNMCISKFKWNKDDSSLIAIRNILCSIYPSKRTIGLKELKNDRIHGYWLYDPKKDFVDNYFHENDFLLPERVMNEFINTNMGIDEYQTISVPYYMMIDTIALYNECRDALRLL